jgi:hypothetical protein
VSDHSRRACHLRSHAAALAWTSVRECHQKCVNATFRGPF